MHPWNPEDYSRNSAVQATFAAALFDALALQGGETILDVGCGDGKITAELARRVEKGGSVVGLDASADMIAFAQAGFLPEKYPNLRFLVGDAQRLPEAFAQGTKFHRVFSNAALHWASDHPAICRGLAQVLADGGKAVLSMGGRGNAQQVRAVLDGLRETPPWQSYFTAFSFPFTFHGPEDYAPWLKAAGLRPLRLELVPKDTVHRGEDAMMGWLRTTWPHIHCIPQERQNDFLQQVMEEYLRTNPPDAQGGIHVAMVRLEIEAVKA